MYCKRCGAPLHQGVVLCPECGARQRRQAAEVRCASCHRRVPLGLNVCPNCGRNVRPAGPRWGLWVAGVAVVGVVGLWGLGKLPVDGAVEQVLATRARLASLVQVIGPESGSRDAVAPVATAAQIALIDDQPAEPEEAASEEVIVGEAEQGALTEAEAAVEAGPVTGAITATEALTVTAPLTATEGLTSTAAITATVPLTPTVELTATAAPTDAPTATPTLEPTATPTLPPTAAPTATSTSIPPTTTPAGRVTYKVKSGDTLSSIAAKYKIGWEELAKANGLTSRSVLRAGQELLVPVAGSAAAPAPTTAPRSQPTKYKVQSGDNLSSIAAKFGITWDELARANGLNSRSVLRIGQELTIPVAGAAVVPSATAAPPATTVAQAATVAPVVPTPTSPPADLPAPVLMGPGDQASFRGSSALIELQWNPVVGMTVDMQYQVVVRWTEQGAPQEHWWATTATGSRVPTWLFSRADQPARQYTWFVRVVQVTTDGQGGERVVPFSPASAIRAFYWG